MNFAIKTIIILSVVHDAFTAEQECFLQDLDHVTEFYFVRHGQTDHNIGKITQNIDVPLNAVGHLQTQKAAQFIAKLPIKTVCFSPLLRARQTKNSILNVRSLPSFLINGLREGTVHDWKELQIVRNKKNVNISKSLTKFLKRLCQGLEKSLIHAAPVLLVAHGGVYSALCRILDVETDLWAVANCTVVRFYKNDQNQWHVQHIFDVGTGSIYDIPDYKQVHI